MVRAIDDGTSLLELTTLALRVKAKHYVGGITDGYRFVFGKLDGGASARGVTLYKFDSLSSVIPQPEGTFLYAISLLDGAE
jgi:hypothetical protein